MSPWEALTSPTWALPIDAFRVMVGLLGAAYFARTWREAPLFSGPDGLVDHGLLRRILPFTRLCLFPPSASLRTLRTLYAVGIAACLLLALGIAPQAAALVAYGLAVSTYRWNMLLMYVDDAIVHLSLFWMILLPVGATLTPAALAGDPATTWAAWLGAEVPGLAVRCLLVNLALVYVVAGLWKLASPMWRRGAALHAVLRMAVAYRPDTWTASLAPQLRLANWGAMLIEAPLALLVVLPPGSPVRWLLLAGAIAFHVGIIATMRFPFANLAMLGAMVVFFGPELMAALGAPPIQPQLMPLGLTDVVAVATTACLALLFLVNALWFDAGRATTLWRTPSSPRRAFNPLYVPLWIIGLAQSYRLFDWIDQRNYRVDYEICEGGRITPADDLFPVSMRHILLQSYLHGNLWLRLDPARLPELRAGILTRYARRYLARHPEATDVEVTATVSRLTPDNLDLHRSTRTRLMLFRRDGDEPRMLEWSLEPPAYT